MVTVDSAINVAVDWVNGLDRSVLGSLAVEHTDLVFNHALMCLRWGDDVEYDDPDIFTVIVAMQSAVSSRLYNATVEYKDKLEDELLFWWSVSDNPVLVERSELNTHDSDLRWFRRYQAVSLIPARLQYFEAGIFDVVTVDRYIDSGIDLNLVSTLEV